MGMKAKTTIPPVPAVPPIPSLPTTSVNPQPRNEASPVAPVPKKVEVSKAVERAGDDKVLKAPSSYDSRSRSIEIQALIKSTLESPVVAQMSVGKNDKDTLEVITKVFNHALELFEKNK